MRRSIEVRIGVRNRNRVYYPWKDIEPADDFLVPIALYGDYELAQRRVCGVIHNHRLTFKEEQYKTQRIGGHIKVTRLK